MKLQILSAINNGVLSPHWIRVPAWADAVSSHEGPTPATLPEIEAELKDLLQSVMALDFDDEPVNTSAYQNAVQYTPITEDHFPVSITFDYPTSLLFHRSYSAPIRLECARIRAYLLNYAAVVQDDSRTLSEVLDVMDYLIQEAHKAGTILAYRTHPDLKGNVSPNRNGLYAKRAEQETETVFYTEIAAEFALYYELSLLFSSILPADKILPLNGFFDRVLLPDEVKDNLRKKYQLATLFHSAQNCDTDTLAKNLTAIYKEVTDGGDYADVVTALENRYGLLLLGEDLPMETLSDERQMFAKFTELKEKTRQEAESTNPRELIAALEKAGDGLYFFSDNSAAYKSIPRRLLDWIHAEIAAYRKNLTTPLLPQTDTPGRRKITGTKRNQKSIDDIKGEAHALVHYLSGYNCRNERIMSADEYNRFLTILDRFIETKTVSNDTPVRVRLSEKCQRFIVHRLGKELKIGKLDIWAEFGWATFEDLSHWEKASRLYQKLSVQAHEYDEDIKSYLGIKKKSSQP